MSDLYQQVQDQDERIQALENNQITSDVNYDTMSNLTDFMRGNFWEFGTATMVAGVVTVTIPNCSLSSVVTISTNSGFHVYADKSTPGQITFSSTSITDTHTVDYFVILNP
jgi:hypothetical protein